MKEKFRSSFHITLYSFQACHCLVEMVTHKICACRKRSHFYRIKRNMNLQLRLSFRGIFCTATVCSTLKVLWPQKGPLTHLKSTLGLTPFPTAPRTLTVISGISLAAWHHWQLIERLYPILKMQSAKTRYILAFTMTSYENLTGKESCHFC